MPAAFLLAVLTAGCTGGDGAVVAGGEAGPSRPAASASSGPDPVASSSQAAADPSAAPSAEPSADPSAGATEPAPSSGTGASATEPSGGPLTVTAVRVARQEGFDRVVLELAGKTAGVPGWQVAYERDPRRDGSGEPVDVAGAAVLVVRVLGAGYPFDTGQQEASSVSVPGDTEVVRDMVLGSVFEGTYEAFIGVSQEAPFRVTRLTGPTRVVVDIDHP